MKAYPYPYPWKELPGTAEETQYLGWRLSEMSVRERYLLEGASQLQSVDTAADLINLTEQLDSFSLCLGATDDAALGAYAARYREKIPEKRISLLDTARWGRDLRERHGGVFTSGGFVEQTSPLQQRYTAGDSLSRLTAGEAVMRLKLASAHCPDGVWLILPDHEPVTGEPDELAAARRALGVTGWDGAVLLEEKCCLWNITNPASQYATLEQLIDAGNNLGYVLEEQGQGMPCFDEYFRTAMELEGCTRLDEALDISQNLNCYDFIPSEEHWEKFGRRIAERSGIVDPDSAAAMYFDYAGYCKSEIERLGLKRCADGYIARNGRAFLHEFSEPAPQEQNLSLNL
ncbi:hypothetical protein [Caproicibacter fermentans]|uniref:Uncharacterized protein n=1 Tax=Caproicibacter fermentans TaxID=2576756 RepID=A0A7G8T8M2_9FIRM|nr:hypothetical protein [Caproicibacter fermentans]QNK39963.1 hypothetical protein HCR03_14795 [Caproicibacter fermentans]